MKVFAVLINVLDEGIWVNAPTSTISPGANSTIYPGHFQLLKQLDKIHKYIKTKNIFYITVKKIRFC
jgi:hypothetical protein